MFGLNLSIPTDYYKELLRRRIWGVTDLPAKVIPDNFGGGRVVGIILNGEAENFMCSRAGCSRDAHATWGACADDNILRPLCPECDVLMNYLAILWMGDPDLEYKLRDYADGVEAEIGRKLESDAWDVTDILALMKEKTVVEEEEASSLDTNDPVQ